jgi:hypothetical protein
MRRAAKNLFLILLTIGIVTNAHAWTREGHTVVVKLALMLMDSTERTKVFALLDTTDASYIGNWADKNYRDKEHKQWHYVNMPAAAIRYKSAFCGDACVVSQLEWAQKYVHDHRHSKESRKEALLWWFHLVADLHQPFHCYNNDDGGGAKRDLSFKNGKTSLHFLWDEEIIRVKQPNVDSLTSAIFHEFYEVPFPDETFAKAANRGHRRAVEAANVPNHVVTPAYIECEWPILEQCLWEAAGMAAQIGSEL